VAHKRKKERKKDSEEEEEASFCLLLAAKHIRRSSPYLTYLPSSPKKTFLKKWKLGADGWAMTCLNVCVCVCVCVYLVHTLVTNVGWISLITDLFNGSKAIATVIVELLRTRGVCHTVTLPFTFKKSLQAKEELWKLKIFHHAKIQISKKIL
jgi:hypothetical protein